MSLDHNWVTAIATAASAVFAATIWWVNWRQLRHTRAVERAYISGGGPLDTDDLNTLHFHRQQLRENTRSARGVCRGVLSARQNPAGSGIRPSGLSAHHHQRSHSARRDQRDARNSTIGNFAPLPRPLLVYGRYWFTDIWKKTHTSGFVLTVPARPALNLPRACQHSASLHCLELRPLLVLLAQPPWPARRRHGQGVAMLGLWSRSRISSPRPGRTRCRARGRGPERAAAHAARAVNDVGHRAPGIRQSPRWLPTRQRRS